MEETDSTGSDRRVGGFDVGEWIRGPPFEWRTQKGGGHVVPRKHG